jgi:hypothetical protein
VTRETRAQLARVKVSSKLASVQPVSTSVLLLLLSVYVQAPTFSSPFSVQGMATPAHVTEVLHAGVPENVMAVAVDVHMYPVTVSVPVHAPVPVPVTVTDPSAFKAKTNVPSLPDVVQLPTSGLLLPLLPLPHPIASTASTAHTMKPLISVIG